jgi:transcriptional regulator ATRX
VFSQSLLSLDLIENFLNKADSASQENASAEEFCGLTGSWSKGLDYFRLDGQTSTDLRSHWCKIFNNKNNLRYDK